MESIPKFLASMITIVVGVLVCISFVIASVMVNSARTFHASVLTEMEASNFTEATIQKCIMAAEESYYTLSVEETVPENGSSAQSFYKVTLNYHISAPIFGKVHNGEIVGYALAGMFPTDIAVEVPEKPVTGDSFIYGDYEYRYNMYHVASGTWSENEEYNGWGARVLNSRKNSYSRPLSMIGDTPVVSLRATYAECADLEAFPKIPDTIIYMQYAYRNCTKVNGELTIPDSVTTLSSAFDGCTLLDTPPVISEGVIDFTQAFRNCINLEEPPYIPSTVTALSAAFEGCTSLTTAPDLTTIIASAGINMNSTFENCISLNTYVGSTDPDGDLSGYYLPNTLKNAYDLFLGCTSLVNAPVIPKNCVNMQSMFEGCTSLTGTVVVHGNPRETYCKDAFKDTEEEIILTGDSSATTKNYLIATANNNNVKIEVEEEEAA